MLIIVLWLLLFVAEFINLHSFTKQVLRLLLVSWVIATAIVVTTGTNIMKTLLTMIVNSTVFVIIRFQYVCIILGRRDLCYILRSNGSCFKTFPIPDV